MKVEKEIEGREVLDEVPVMPSAVVELGGAVPVPCSVHGVVVPLPYGGVVRMDDVGGGKIVIGEVPEPLEVTGLAVVLVVPFPDLVAEELVREKVELVEPPVPVPGLAVVLLVVPLP